MARPHGSDPTEPVPPRAMLPAFGRRTTDGPGVWGAIAALIVVALLVWLAADVLLLTFAAVLLAIFLRAPTDAIARHTPITAGWALALVCVALVGLAALGVVVIVPKLSGQFGQLTEQIPESISKIESWLAQRPWGVDLVERIQSGEGLPKASAVLSQAGGAFTSALGVIGNAVLVLFLGLFFAVDPHVYRKGLVLLAPPSRRPQIAESLDATGETLRWWIVGTLSSMTVVAVLTTTGLLLLGMPLAFSLGLLAGLLAFIPNLGPVLGLLPALLIALLQGPWMVLWVAMLYLGVQMVETYLVTPTIQRRAVSLPPALTLVAQVLLGGLFGFMGLLLATPLTAAALVLVKILYLRDVLGDHVEARGLRRQEPLGRA